MPRRILTKKGKAVRIEGIPEITKQANEILAKTGYRTGSKIAVEIKDVLIHAAMVLRDEARDLAPVKTGKLRSSIFAARGDDAKPNVLVGVNYKIAPHAHLQEFGTVHSQPQPFMRPAITATRSMVARIVADGIREVVKRWGK